MAEKMYGKDMAEKMYLNGCFIGAGNDVAPLLVFYGYISSNVFFKSYYLHRDGKNKTLRPCTDGLPSIGIRFGGQPLHIQAIKSINRKIFVFSKKNIRNSTDIYFAESANGDDFNWVPFFRSSRKDLSIENERAMAYGGGRYVLIANGGIVFTKTEKDNGEWKGSGAWKEFRISISNMIAKNATTFKNINIVYGNNMFALAFCSYDDKTYFYTSPNGEVWHHKIEEGSRLDTLTSFAGGSFGFALTNIAGELCYSKSFDDLIKVERKVAEKVAEYEAEFHTVFCINSFFGCTFVALMKGIGGGCDILLGIPVRKEGNISDIKWLKTDSRIYISNDGYVRNINKDIRNIFSNTDGDIITIGGKVSDKKWVTWS
jgi:hypothetical protein